MTADTTGVERALGAIGTTFRLSRLYPATHPALVEAIRQVGGTLPTIAAMGTVEFKIGATGLHWHGQHLVPRNTQVSELAGLLYARGVRSIQLSPGLAPEHVLALFGVATGAVAVNDQSLGHITLGLGRRGQRTSTVTPAPQPAVREADTPAPAPQPTAPVASSAPVIAAASPAPPPPPPSPPPAAPAPVPVPVPVPVPAPAPVPVSEGASGVAFRPDVVPVDVAVKRAIAGLTTAADAQARRDAVATLRSLTPRLLGLRDVQIVADAVRALDQLFVVADDAELAGAIGGAAESLADRATVERMVARLAEPKVPPPEREALMGALGALAVVSIGPVLHAYIAAAIDQREPYRAVIRRAGDRALEALQGRLVDPEPTVVAAAAELIGLTGTPQAVALLVPLLRHESDFVREATLTGLAEVGGREIARPAMPALKDPSVGVRAAAARAIAAAGDGTATTVLVRRLEQEDDDGVLAELLRALGRLGSREALEVLARHAEPGGVLKRRSPMVRAAAVEGLGLMPSREARALVELYTHDKELTVRKAAEAALR